MIKLLGCTMQCIQFICWMLFRPRTAAAGDGMLLLFPIIADSIRL